MTITRHFLGWDAPAVRKVRDYLIPSTPEGPVDLRSTLVLVPTRHAGRRLREALTVYCAEHNTYLLAPALRTPFQLVRPASDDGMAYPVDVIAAWTHLLRSTDMRNFPGLFPSGAPAGDFHWALQTGSMLQTLRDELSEHGQSIRSVLADYSAELEEIDRWKDLERLEASVPVKAVATGAARPLRRDASSGGGSPSAGIRRSNRSGLQPRPDSPCTPGARSACCVDRRRRPCPCPRITCRRLRRVGAAAAGTMARRTHRHRRAGPDAGEYTCSPERPCTGCNRERRLGFRGHRTGSAGRLDRPVP